MSQHTHAIVWFKNVYTNDGLKVIDLVPCEWIIENGKQKFCLYPPKIKRNMVRQWSKNSKQPSLKWVKTAIEIIKFACKYCKHFYYKIIIFNIK